MCQSQIVHVLVVQATGEVDKLHDMDYNPRDWGRVEYKSCFSLNDRVETNTIPGALPPLTAFFSPSPGVAPESPYSLRGKGNFPSIPKAH